MNNTKFALRIIDGCGVNPCKQLELFKEVGFDGFFAQYPYDCTDEIKAAADSLGLIFQSIHAPTAHMRDMWTKTDNTQRCMDELIASIDCCVKYGVDILVVHPFIGFGYKVVDNFDFGLNNFSKIADYAKQHNINIAFENLEGEEYLTALMTKLDNYDNVGFCWDTGHELCYNLDKDMLALYGDRLIATHINDNFGKSGDEIYLTDDLHLLPFDGIKDWHDAMLRLDNSGFDGIMTFELKMSPDTDTKFGTDYTSLDFTDYLKTAYERACKLRDMRKKQSI